MNAAIKETLWQTKTTQTKLRLRYMASKTAIRYGSEVRI
jgi:hypothetical protein